MLEQVIFYTILVAFLVTVLLSPIFIPFLRRLKFGQSIREEGPQSHLKKREHPPWAVWSYYYLLPSLH